MDDGKKTLKKLFCLSTTEAKLLRQKAKERGMNDSEYLRLMISQKPVESVSERGGESTWRPVRFYI